MMPRIIMRKSHRMGRGCCFALGENNDVQFLKQYTPTPRTRMASPVLKKWPDAVNNNSLQSTTFQSGFRARIEILTIGWRKRKAHSIRSRTGKHVPVLLGHDCAELNPLVLFQYCAVGLVRNVSSVSTGGVLRSPLSGSLGSLPQVCENLDSHLFCNKHKSRIFGDSLHFHTFSDKWIP